MPPCGVSNVIYSIEDITGNVWRDVGDSHVASDKAVVASDSLLAPPPPASSEVEMVDLLTVGKRTRPPDLSDGDGSGSAPYLKKGTKKRVRESRTAAVLSQTVFRQATRSIPATCSTGS